MSVLNDVCQTYVIPIGRHSIIRCRWQRNLTLTETNGMLKHSQIY